MKRNSYSNIQVKKMECSNNNKKERKSSVKQEIKTTEN